MAFLHRTRILLRKTLKACASGFNRVFHSLASRFTGVDPLGIDQVADSGYRGLVGRDEPDTRPGIGGSSCGS
jgi:hypothetical protein